MDEGTKNQLICDSFCHAGQMAYAVEGLRYNAAAEANQPFVIYGGRVFKDGNQWCALLGSNIVEGVVGFGETPEKAITAFNKAWYEN